MAFLVVACDLADGLVGEDLRVFVGLPRQCSGRPVSPGPGVMYPESSKTARHLSQLLHNNHNPCTNTTVGRTG